MLPPRRALKRISNRLAKKGLRFVRIEQNDAQLITMRLILETKREQLGRAFIISREWLRTAPPRVIADRVVNDYLAGYGHLPAAAHRGARHG